MTAVLFDLDGTLLDTVSDLLYALNKVRVAETQPELSLEAIKAIVNLGSKAMIKHAFGIDETHQRYPTLRQQFLDIYEQHIAHTTQFFPNVERVLSYLEHEKIPWGIVTNRLTRHTLALLKALGMDERPACIVCGDSLTTHKPDPAPIRYACHLLQKNPQDCIYIGDAVTDVTASKAAGTTSLVALYGYISKSDDPLTWKADGYINNPIEIIHWLEKNSA